MEEEEEEESLEEGVGAVGQLGKAKTVMYIYIYIYIYIYRSIDRSIDLSTLRVALIQQTHLHATRALKHHAALATVTSK